VLAVIPPPALICDRCSRDGETRGRKGVQGRVNASRLKTRVELRTRSLPGRSRQPSER